MGGSFGINSIASYANDPGFAYAYASPNLNYLKYMQEYQKLAEAQQASQASQTSNSSSAPSATQISYDPAFRGSSNSGGSNAGYWLTGIAAVGATALLYAKHKGNGEGIMAGFRNIINGLRGKGAKSVQETASEIAEKAGETSTTRGVNRVSATGEEASRRFSNIIEKGGEHIGERVIEKDGTSFVLDKNGRVKQIITRERKTISDPAEIAQWQTNNPTRYNEVTGIDFKGVLGDNVHMTYTRTIKDETGKFYTLTVKDGEVIKAIRVADENGTALAGEKEIKDLAGFLKNGKRNKQVEEALTLTRKVPGNNVIKVLDKDGKLVDDIVEDLTVSVKDGKAVKVTCKDSSGKVIELKPEEIEAFNKGFKDEIKKFGHEDGTFYGLTNVEYTLGGKKEKTHEKLPRVTFTRDTDGTITIKSVTEPTTSAPMTTKAEIKAFFNKNKGISRKELEEMGTTGTLVEGYRLGRVVYEEGGKKFEIVGENVRSVILDKDVTIGGKTIAAGTKIEGKDFVEWRKIQENENSVQEVLDLLVA